MKTAAEKWIKKIDDYLSCQDNDIDNCRKFIQNIVPEIQQDALKQGYIDACKDMLLECEKMKGMKNEKC